MRRRSGRLNASRSPTFAGEVAGGGLWSRLVALRIWPQHRGPCFQTSRRIGFNPVALTNVRRLTCKPICKRRDGNRNAREDTNAAQLSRNSCYCLAQRDTRTRSGTASDGLLTRRLRVRFPRDPPQKSQGLGVGQMLIGLGLRGHSRRGQGSSRAEAVSALVRRSLRARTGLQHSGCGRCP